MPCSMAAVTKVILSGGNFVPVLHIQSGIRVTLVNLTSTNLASWTGVATNQFGPAGTALFQLTPGNEAQRYFRLELP
jgi:hypothetical protein